MFPSHRRETAHIPTGLLKADFRFSTRDMLAGDIESAEAAIV